MTVRELLHVLSECDLDAEVIIQKDAEGNDFSPLSYVGNNYVYVPYSTWSGEVWMKELSMQDVVEGYTEDDVYYGDPVEDDAVNAVILAPIN